MLHTRPWTENQTRDSTTRQRAMPSRSNPSLAPARAAAVTAVVSAGTLLCIFMFLYLSIMFSYFIVGGLCPGSEDHQPVKSGLGGGGIPRARTRTRNKRGGRGGWGRGRSRARSRAMSRARASARARERETERGREVGRAKAPRAQTPPGLPTCGPAACREDSKEPGLPRAAPCKVPSRVGPAP